MSHRNQLLLAAAAALAGAGWWSHLAFRERQLRVQATTIQRRLDTQHRLAAACALRGNPRPVPASGPQASPAASGANPGRPSSALGDSLVAIDRLAAMPEYAPLLRRELRRQTLRQYAGLFPLLGLAPDRLEAFKLLLDETAATMKDLYGRAMASGTSLDNREFLQLVHQYGTEADARIRSFLGPDGYGEYLAYQQGATWRNVQLPEVQSYFGLHEAPPLTEAQQQALGAAFREAQAWMPAQTPLAPGPLYRRRNERLAEIAGASLAPAQREALNAYVQFANEREQTLAQFVRPNDPDSVIATLISSRSAP